MSSRATIEVAAHDFARYCGEPWPAADYAVDRFVSMLVAWAEEIEWPCKEAEKLLNEFRRR